jgi:hypothetical protein
MVALLDYRRQGYVLLKDLFMVFILTDCEVPGVEGLGRYKRELEKAAGGAAGGAVGAITKEKYVNVPAWFDESQAQEKAESKKYFEFRYEFVQ